MAGAVAGGGALLSASLKVLLNRMDSPEVRTFLRGQKLSATLRRELKMKLLAVKAVLNDAEAKQITNSDVKDWMDELKDAVYDAEDLVDDITTEALRCKMESDSQSQSQDSLSRSSRDFLHPNYRKLDSVGEWADTWRREKANHIQCHSTAEYGFVPPKFRWWHFESLEQFPEEALPKPPYAIYGPLVASEI